MLSLEHSFEYSSTQNAPSFRLELVMLLFCLAGILLFVAGILVGKQVNLASWAQDEIDKVPKQSTVAHGRFGVPRYQLPAKDLINPNSIGLIGLDHNVLARN
jgi:hypothetical protein